MSDIRKSLLKGVFWSAVEKYSGLIISIVISMVLARLLGPKEYGVVAIATVIIAFLQMFCTMGIGPAIIQRKDLNEQDLNSIFTFSLSIGLALSALFFFSSWSIAAFYNNPQLIPVCQILSVALLSAAANMVPSALMNRDKRFKENAKRTLFFQIICGVAAIVAALNGAGVYALLISPVVTPIGVFIWNRQFYKVRIDWSYNLEPIKRIFSFSSYQFLSEFVNYFSRNLDKLIIGKFLSVDALGIYEKSYRLMQLPLQNVTGVISPVLQPILRDLQDDKADLGRKYAKIVKLVATISFPAGIILAFMSREVIFLFYGDKWEAAIPVFSILSLSLPLQMIFSTSGSMYLVCNNTKAQFWVGIRNTATTVVGFLIAAYFWKSIEAMAWAWTITLFLNFACSYYILYRYVMKVPITPLLQVMIKPFVYAVLLALVLWGLNSVDYGNGITLPLLVKGATSLILTLVLIQLTRQYDLVSLLKTRIKK